jgi:hypothetical protein
VENMTVKCFRGEVPNLELLLEDLKNDKTFPTDVETRIEPSAPNADEFGNADWGTLIIEWVVKPAEGALILEAVKTAVVKARRRGLVEALESDADGEPGTPDA